MNEPRKYEPKFEIRHEDPQDPDTYIRIIENWELRKLIYIELECIILRYIQIYANIAFNNKNN